MPTRRDVLLASIAAGVAMKTRTVFAKAAQPATAVTFEVPAGACDCHTHIHPDPAKFPMFAGRVYTPELASPPRRLPTAAVAMVVRGHSALTATPSRFNSPAIPSTHMLMPNFAMV